MAMQLLKKTSGYRIYRRGDDRYAVRDAHHQAVNGEEKVKILLAEGLLSSRPAAPAAEPAPEPAGEDGAGEASAEGAE